MIDVLISPLLPDIHNPIELLRSCVAEPRKAHILLTITQLNGEVNGLRRGDMLRYEGMESLAVFGDEEIQNEINTVVRRLMSKSKSAPGQFELADGRELELFVEIIPPVIHVVLMGQQYDVYPLVKIIKELGWQASVVANRQKVTQKLFAAADAIVSPDEFSQLVVDEYTALVLMAHDFKTDKYNLPKALTTAASYIGILGPRIRFEKMLTELATEGIQITDSDRIHAPAGLDIGAVSPEEIALSIVAEIRADLSGRDGTFLRLRQTTIHER